MCVCVHMQSRILRTLVHLYIKSCINIHFQRAKMSTTKLCDYEDLRPVICVACARHVIPTLLVTPAQLMRPGIGRNASCALGNCLTIQPDGCLWPRELWFSCTDEYHVHVYIQKCIK